MQSLEKALHQPMPFTTGGQTITDRLTAARHAIAGSQLGKTICKATTEELVGPKKKHLDYLLHCTNEPNVSIPSMANLLIERTQNTNWVVVYKALITIHNIMCYGNERFSQYLASCNTTFNLTSFLDKSNPQGYDMSNHVRRYGKYISEKIFSYRLCAFDFCKIKRGREDGVLRVMHTDKLLKTLPTLQNQMDALLEFQVTPGELNNGVINCSFILLFRDLIRLFACYNDAVINLLEKFFDMNKKQAREGFDLYKSFLLRLDKVAAFLSVAESVGVDKGEIPDLTRAPASLVDALEAHLHHLEGGKGPAPSQSQQFVTQQLQQSQQQTTSPFTPMSANIDDTVKQRYIEEEKERLRLYEEQRQKQVQQPTSSNVFNPFASQATSQPPPIPPQPNPNNTGNDPPLLFTQYQQGSSNAIPHSDLLELYKQPPSIDPTNPFAPFIQQPQQQQPYDGYSGYPQQQMQQQQPYYPQQQPPPLPPQPQQQQVFNPFAMAPSVGIPQQFTQQPQQQQQQQPDQNTMASAAINPFAAPISSYQTPPPQTTAAPVYAQSPPTAPVPTTATEPTNIPQTGQSLGIYEQTPFSGNDASYTSPSYLQQQMEQQQAQQPVQQSPPQIPVSGGVPPAAAAPTTEQSSAPGGPPRPPPPGAQIQQPQPTQPSEASGTFDPFANASAQTNNGNPSDIDKTLSNLVNNMDIKNPSWMNAHPAATTQGGWPQTSQAPPTYGAPSNQSNANPFNPFG